MINAQETKMNNQVTQLKAQILTVLTKKGNIIPEDHY